MKTLRHEGRTNRQRYRWARLMASTEFAAELDDGCGNEILRAVRQGELLRAESVPTTWELIQMREAEKLREWWANRESESQRLRRLRLARERRQELRDTRLREAWQAEEDRIQREWDLAHPDPHYPPAPVEPDPPFTPEQDAEFHRQVFLRWGVLK